MSLNPAQRLRTSEELRANLRLCGAAPARLAEQLGFTAERLADTLEVNDRSDGLVRARGAGPVRYSVLTEQARRAAATWFPPAPPSWP